MAEGLISSGRIASFDIDEENELGSVLHITRVPYITYPYEWCFSQLREAAVLTLELMRGALDYGMILKDASAFNVAFQKCSPIFIDHTSFEFYNEGTPWRAYRQFAMHFIAPLLLMQKVDLRCLKFFREDIGGIPLDLASRLLPLHTWLQINPLLHIHCHSLFERRYSSDKSSQNVETLPKGKLGALLESLNGWISSMKPPKQATEWADYYNDNSYSELSFSFKQQAVAEFCARNKGECCIDLGANFGLFTRIASEHFACVIAADYDARAVEALFSLGKTLNAEIQPLLLDLNNPSPDLGVFNLERESFFNRTKANCALGLALTHHLRITGNWSIRQIVSLFDRLAPCALVEFVPLDDIQVQRLTRGRDEIYQDWTLDNLCRSFKEKYSSCTTTTIPESNRVLIEISR
ncbi:MAG: hypothetical protein IJS15_08965 [Victivallales bacterium]|nr:hypothetical protein [Victivallales bacterium]